VGRESRRPCPIRDPCASEANLRMNAGVTATTSDATRAPPTWHRRQLTDASHRDCSRPHTNRRRLTAVRSPTRQRGPARRGRGTPTRGRVLFTAFPHGGPLRRSDTAARHADARPRPLHRVPSRRSAHRPDSAARLVAARHADAWPLPLHRVPSRRARRPDTRPDSPRPGTPTRGGVLFTACPRGDPLADPTARRAWLARPRPRSSTRDRSPPYRGAWAAHRRLTGPAHPPRTRSSTPAVPGGRGTRRGAGVAWCSWGRE
jgi:hypothetical protein